MTTGRPVLLRKMLFTKRRLTPVLISSVSMIALEVANAIAARSMQKVKCGIR
jgi:hypothetical protein